MCVKELENTSLVCGSDRDLESVDNPTSAPAVDKVWWLKPSPVLTGSFNRLKPTRSICQKVVNTGQYKSELSIENLSDHFSGG